MRKLITVLILSILFGLCGCRRNIPLQAGGDWDINVWLSPGKEDIRYSIATTPVTYSMLDLILGKATEDWRRRKLDDHHIAEMMLVYNLDPRLTLSNALPAVALANKHGFSNVVVRLNRVEPPRTCKKGEENIIY